LIVARTPRTPNPLGSLSGVYVAGPFNAVTTVFFVPTMDARSADKPVKAGSDCFCGTHRAHEYPNLNHVSGFPVIAGVIEARGDNDSLRVFMKDEAVVHRRPPIHSARAGMAIRRAKPSKQSGPWKRGGMRFIGSAGGGLKGAFNFNLKFSTDTHAVGVGYAVPNERAG
jgi:hypothetical protein